MNRPIGLCNSTDGNFIKTRVDILNPPTSTDALAAINYLILKGDRYYKGCIMMLEEHGREMMNIPLPPHNYTAFLRAVSSGSIKLVNYMLKNGACINMKNTNGESAMYLAVYRVSKAAGNDHQMYKKCVPLLNCLFKAGCDINVPNCNGFTPLHVAVKEASYFVTLWLLKRCANPRMRSIKSFKRPIDVARQFSGESIYHLMIVKLLERYETRPLVEDQNANSKFRI